MVESPSAQVQILPNAQNFRIGEQKNYIIHGNHISSANDQDGLIRLLQPILDASHTRDREISPPNSACFPGTRTDVIRRIVAWANSTLLWNTHILWLYGYVGCGKSAIALAIALVFEENKRLVGSFFFFRNTGDRSRMTKFATTLACQLAAAIPEAAPFIEKAVKAEPGLLESNLVTQLRRLVYEPFKAAERQLRSLKTFFLQSPFLVVIDGLDECEDRQGVQAFIEDLVDFFKKNPFIPLRFLITSRVEQHIQGHLENGQVRLENLVNHCSREDIDTFMITCFEDVKRRNPVIKAYIQEHGDWPTKKDKDQLVDHIGGSFIFGSALFKYIVDSTNDQSTPMERLPHTLNMNPGLDTLYITTLSRSQNLPHFLDIISTLALLFQPLPIAGIAELLGIGSFEVVRVLVNLQAILHVPGTDDLPVTFCHTSLRDFLTESRSGPFYTPPSYHLFLLYRCSILHDGRRSGTPAASYSIAHCAEHLKQVICLPSSAQGPFPRFPETLDALYTHVLEKSKDLPHFFDVISAILLVPVPLSTVEITELLGIEVSRVLDSLQAIIEPVALRHESLRRFLTETRSGIYLVSPSSHLKLSYCFFRLNFEHLMNKFRRSQLSQDSKQHCQYHWDQFLNATSDQGIFAELEQLPHLHHQLLSYHLFSFAQVFFWLFGDDSDHKPRQVFQPLTKCIENLALAVECDTAPDRWLRKRFGHLGLYRLMRRDIYRLKIHQEQATTLRHSIQRVETAIRLKHLTLLTENPVDCDIDHFNSSEWLGSWTPLQAYKFFKWMSARVQVEMNTAAPAVSCDLDLHLTWGRTTVRVPTVFITVMTTVAPAARALGLLYSWLPASNEEVVPLVQLHDEAAEAWGRYVDNGHKSSDLAETMEKCHEALDETPKEHPQRNELILILVCALLEHDLDQPSLEKIDEYFTELDGWNGEGNRQMDDLCTIAERLAAEYHELYNQAPSDSNFEGCVSNYSRVGRYSDQPEDRIAANLNIVALYRQRGPQEAANLESVVLYRQRGTLDAAMRAIEEAKSACPGDQLDLLASISMAKFTLHQDVYGSNKSSEELEKAIAEGETILRIQFDIPPTQRAAILAGVAQCICALSEVQPSEVRLSGQLRDAVKYAQEAVGLSAGEDGLRIQASIALASAVTSSRWSDGAVAWIRNLDGQKLAETIVNCNQALDTVPKEHPQRNNILLLLVLALLEHNLDQPLLEKIKKHFGEIEGPVWSALEHYRKDYAHAIATKLAAGYHKLYNQEPCDSDFERCVSNYSRVEVYSDKPEDRMDANLSIVTLYRQRGPPETVHRRIVAFYRQRGTLEAAMGAFEGAKSVCPRDRPDLLFSIYMAKFTLHQDIYESTRSREELERAIAEGQAAVRIQFDAPLTQRADIFAGVARCIFTLSEGRSARWKKSDAIKYARKAVDLGVGEEGIKQIQASAALSDAVIYNMGVSAWNRYVDKGRNSSDLTEAIEKCHEALSMDAAQNEHTERNDILLMLTFALLEQSLDQSSLEKIEHHFSELEGWSDLGNADAHAIAAKLASGYHELYNQTQTPSDFQRCLSSYTKVRQYSVKPEDRTEASLSMAALHRQRGQLEAAMEVIETEKSACPADKLDLLSSISMAKVVLHQEIYNSTGSSEELEKAITEGEDALQAQFDMPPPRRAALLTGVARSICALSEARPLEVNFEGRIRGAIRYARESVGLNVGEQDSRNEAGIALADALSSRRIKPTVRELDEAIGLYRKAKDSDALGGDQQLLASLANAISFRCEKEEDPENGTTFQSAVDLYEKALMASDDNRWNAHVANNIAWIYVNKANNTKAEVDYESARENYLKAAEFLEDVGTESDDPGEANDVDYYKGQAEAIQETIVHLRELARPAWIRRTDCVHPNKLRWSRDL